MSYAQINYDAIQGINGKYTIHDIGCLLTASCNVEEAFGTVIDPLQLNIFFRDTDTYIDVDDGIRDDLGWNSITRHNPNIVVSRVGTGWPSTNNAIVKFNYRSPRSGQMVTHFCKIADINAHTIVDSWDGQVKSPGIYGEPVAFAEYTGPTAQPVTPPQTVDYSSQELFLPAAAGTWRVYNEGGPYFVGQEVGRLAPGNYPPGLTYDILGNPQRYVYTIQTEVFGRVAIYAGPDTIAEFRDKAAPPPPEAPAEPAFEPQLQWEQLESPLNLMAGKAPTAQWDLTFKDYGDANPVAWLSLGTPIRAFGKVTRTDHRDRPVYFVEENDFVNRVTAGFNTVDVTLAPATPVTPESATEAEASAPIEEPTQPETSSDGESIPVSVNPDAWKASFKTNLAGTYTAKKSVTIHDIEGLHPDVQLVRGRHYNIAGTFSRNGEEGYRTTGSVTKNTWYRIPLDAIQHSTMDGDSELMLETIGDDMVYQAHKLGTKAKVIKAAAINDVKHSLHLPHPFKKKK